MGDHLPGFIEHDAVAARGVPCRLFCDLLDPGQSHIEGDDTDAVGELFRHGSENRLRLIIEIGPHKGDIAVIVNGFDIPGTLGRDITLIRYPADAVAVLAVDPAVEAGVIHVNRLLDTEGFGGEVIEDLGSRLIFPDHLIDHMTCKHDGVLAHQQIIVKLLRRLHDVDSALQVQGFLRGIIQKIGAGRGCADREKKYEQRCDDTSSPDVSDDISDFESVRDVHT